MWFVWGTKNTRKRLGCVADYCPICHESRAFVLSELGEATHVYGVALGGGAVTGHVITCEACGVELDGDPRRYARIMRDDAGGLQSLVATTHPSLPDLEQSQRDWIRRLREGEQQGRADAVIRPLYLVAVAYERRKLAMKLGVVGWLVSFTGVVLVSIWVGDALATLSSSPWLPVLPAVVMGALFLGLVLDRATDSARYLNKVSYPALKRALGPLRPNLDELGAAQSQLTAMRLRLAKRLAPRDVQRVLTS